MDRTVAVTGGSGKLGRAVVAALIEDGWTVVNFDRVPSPDSRARFIRTDLTDYGQVVEALSGIDEVHSGVNAVVHLAAIPGATFAPNVATFDNNLVSTFHVFQAAKLFEIHNLVWPQARHCLATRSITHRRTCHSMRTCHLPPKSSTPLPRTSKRRWPASTAAGTRLRR